MGKQERPNEVEETGWPADGGRSFARNSWIDIGPYDYRGSRFLQITTKAVAVIVLGLIILGGAYLAYASINEGSSPAHSSPPVHPVGPMPE